MAYGNRLRKSHLFLVRVLLEVLYHIHDRKEEVSPSRASLQIMDHLWNPAARDQSRYSEERLDCRVDRSLAIVLCLEVKMLCGLYMVLVRLPNVLGLDRREMMAVVLCHLSYLCIPDQALDLDPGYRPASLDLCPVLARLEILLDIRRQSRLETLSDWMRGDLSGRLGNLLGLLEGLWMS